MCSSILSGISPAKIVRSFWQICWHSTWISSESLSEILFGSGPMVLTAIGARGSGQGKRGEKHHNQNGKCRETFSSFFCNRLDMTHARGNCPHQTHDFQKH
jgi:hypothetical protein